MSKTVVTNPKETTSKGICPCCGGALFLESMDEHEEGTIERTYSCGNCNGWITEHYLHVYTSFEPKEGRTF